MTVEQKAEYIDCRNKSWRERRDKQKEINYFTGFDDGYHECEKEHEWHDLRKDKNDLPQKMVSNHNFSIEVLSDKGEIVRYNFHYCEWFYWRSGEPIAWCEIPTFDKE